MQELRHPPSPGRAAVAVPPAPGPPWILIPGSHVPAVTKPGLTGATFPTQPEAAAERRPQLGGPHPPGAVAPAHRAEAASGRSEPHRYPSPHAGRGRPRRGSPRPSRRLASARRPRTV